MTHIGGQENIDTLDGNDDSLNHLDGKELENTVANYPSGPMFQVFIGWRFKFSRIYWICTIKTETSKLILTWDDKLFSNYVAFLKIPM